MRCSRGVFAALTSVAMLATVTTTTLSGTAGASVARPTSTHAGSFAACMVTDTGGIDDRSFNASSYQGLLLAHKEDPSITTQYLQSTTQSDYVPNINALIAKKCGIIVTVGFLMGGATQAAAKKHPTQHFAIVDYPDTGPVLSNEKGLEFNTAQSGFLGGYLAAGMTKSGTVATFGGEKLPTVTIYMDGYYDGVQYYNQKHGKSVKVLGWNEKTQKGSFTGDFTDETKGQNLTNTFIQEGADIIFPVAGNVGLGAAAAAKQSGTADLLWVDTDGCISAPQYCSIFISSVEKGIQVAVANVTVNAAKGTFKGGNYIGTLANNGVGIAPFHQFASKVPATLQSELKQVRAGIVSGAIKVASPAVKDL
jgi:basic membrane protein A